jgi:hypothetical protein
VCVVKTSSVYSLSSFQVNHLYEPEGHYAK